MTPTLKKKLVANRNILHKTNGDHQKNNYEANSQ